MAKFGAALCAVILIVLLPCLDVALGQSTDPSEVNALRAIKGRLVDPMNNLKNWNRGDPCRSNWTGVFCHRVNDDTFLHTVVQEESLRLLNGHQLSGILPDEIGNLQNLNRLQVDQNQLFGPIPKSFANLRSVKHIHMNNNSLSGSLPPELSRLPLLLHLLVDNNNLSGPLPPEFAEAPALKIFQADNNNFSGSSIPTTYSNISTLLKLSLRNCSLQGAIPDLSSIPQLGYLDISWNQLTGPIPTNKLASNITTIDLSHNMLNGTIPQNFSGLPNLQILSLEDNNLDGSVPSTIWNGVTLTGNRSLVLDFQNNSLKKIPATFDPPPNVAVMLYGNPVCGNTSGDLITNLCQPMSVDQQPLKKERGSTFSCQPCPADKNYEYNRSSPIPCFCVVPLGVGLRLKSPGITDFRPYEDAFDINLTSLLQLFLYQINIEHYIWEVGPRLNMHMKLFPSNSSLFNTSEIVRLGHILAGWEITLSDVFGPYELLNFTLGSYADEFPNAASTGLSKAALGIILAGSIAGAIALSVVATTLIARRCSRHRTVSKHSLSRFSVKIDGVRCFTFDEMAIATNNFDLSAQVGQGGYGKVYKGILADGAIVAIKRAHDDSLQGSKEFCTDIELLSRLHHRNLVSLMLVYEFMSNGTLRDHLSAKSKRPLSFGLRLKIALGAAKGILYLHTEANPPIFHRDVKASNILLDSKFVAKVADFGLSRLAPVPDVEGTLPAHVSTVVKGTPGYLDPEYFLTHKLTDKSDVYSLGVVFLEMLTGLKPIEHGKNIVREVNSACQSGKISEIIDSRMGLYPPDCVRRFLSLEPKCCQDETDDRPSMWEIVRELELILRMMPEEDLVLLETSETDSTDVSKSLSASASGALFVSSQVSGSLDASSGMISVRVTPR
ncbi:putative LRR receptor-like serine/threonine-protein kinase [Panicum miliaceum]|uniref:non-specific serine/threonine protein kinase n=1 Tax=Panicum miliaceum TaxID=4540 RepID=A0A3L6SW66_PANMI|nr:putative LRR receptor-like serine/threonine-protein kinase [Panicum miliaceum]